MVKPADTSDRHNMAIASLLAVTKYDKEPVTSAARITYPYLPPDNLGYAA